MKDYPLDPLAYLLGWFSHQNAGYQFILFSLSVAITTMVVTIIRNTERNRITKMFFDEIDAHIARLGDNDEI